VECGDGLFRGGDEVFLVLGGDDFVQLLVKLLKLSGLGHLFLVHEEGRLDLLVALFTQEVETVGDEGLVEVDTVPSEVVPAMASNLGTC
jgi:hypothetical protein